MRKIFLIAVIFTFFLIPIVMANEGVVIDSVSGKGFEIINRTYFGSYIKWTWEEVNDTHWLFNFKVKQELVDDVKYCLGLQKPKQDLCWKYVRQEYKYLNLADLKAFKTHIKKLSTFPLINLTENIAVSLASIDLSQGIGSFYVIFPNGFKEGEMLKFGFDSTGVAAVGATYFYPNKRNICRDDQGNIHVTWVEIDYARYKNSTNNGTSFSSPATIIEHASGHNFRPSSISCSGANVTIAFFDATDATIRIYRSTDRGGTFTLKTEPDHSQCDVMVSELGQVQDKGSRIYIGYGCGQMDPTTLYTVCFDRSTDGGGSWDGYDDILILEDTEYWFDIAMEVDGSGDSDDRIYVASYQTLDNNIQFTYSTDGGSSWSAQDVIMSGTYSDPSLAFHSSNIYVVAQTVNTYQIWFTESDDYGISWNTPERIDTLGATANRAKLASVTVDADGLPWVFWEQNDTYWNYDIVYRRYNGTDWLPVDGFYNITKNNLGHHYVTTKAEFNWDRIEFLWRVGTGSPYSIYYESIILETAPPVYSNNQNNTTGAGQPCEFNLTWDDNVALHTTGQYIFSTNNSGVWANASAVNFTATPQNATNVTTLNSTEGTVVAWCYYAKDNEGNWNNTNCESGKWFTLTTTSAGAEYERFFTQGLDLTFISYKEFDLQRIYQQDMGLSEQQTRNFNLQKGFDNSILFDGQFKRNIDFEKWFENSMGLFFEGSRTGDYQRDFGIELELSEDWLRNFNLTRYFDVDMESSLQTQRQINLIKTFANYMQLSSDYSRLGSYSRISDLDILFESDYQRTGIFERVFSQGLLAGINFDCIFEGAAEAFERFFNAVLGFSSEHERQIDFSRPFNVGIVGDALFSRSINLERTVETDIGFSFNAMSNPIYQRFFSPSLGLSANFFGSGTFERMFTTLIEIYEARSRQINLGRGFSQDLTLSADYSRQISFTRAFDMPMEMETDYQRIMDVMREFSTGIKLSADFFIAGVPQIFERIFGLVLEMRIGFVPTKEFVRCWIYGYVVFDDLDDSFFFCKDYYNLYDNFNECYGYCMNYFDEGKCALFCRLTA